jgi:hypothetical protein
MNWDFETDGTVGSEAAWLEMPGTFALRIMKVRPNENRKGELEDGTLAIDCTVVGADVATQSQIGKEATLTARRPQLTDKNGGAFHKKKLTAIAIATGQAGKKDAAGHKISMNPAAMVGRIIVAKFTKEKMDNGKEFISQSFADIWHVDDVKAQGEHLPDSLKAALPADQREDPKELAKWYADPHNQQAQQQPAPPAASGSSSLFDDI